MTDNTNDDQIHRFLIKDTDIRGEIITLTTSFTEAYQHQIIPDALLPIFGQFLTGACMISEILKFDGTVTLQARGDGPVSVMMSECNKRGDVRGVFNIDEDQAIYNDDCHQVKPISELLGKGALSMVLDPKRGERYQGIVPLDGSNLADCLIHYFTLSEQVPTHIVLFGNEKQCGGIFLQCLPAQKVNDMEARKSYWETAIQLLNTANMKEFFDVSHNTMLYRLFHEQGCEVLSGKDLRFRCSCSYERSANALTAIGEQELRQIIAEQLSVDMDCKFCGTQYQFTEDDINVLFGHNQSLH